MIASYRATHRYERGRARRFGATLGAVFVAATLSGASAHAAERQTNSRTLDHIVAVVGNDTITRAELQDAINLLTNEYEAKRETPPPLDEMRAQIIERLIFDKLQEQEAERLGIQIDELALDRSMEQLAERNNMSLEELRRTAERDGISYADLRARVRARSLGQRVIQQAVINNIEVSEKEIDDEINARGLNADFEYRFARIAVASPEHAPTLNAARRALSDYDDLSVARINRLLQRFRATALKGAKKLPSANATDDETPQDAAPRDDIAFRTRALEWRATDELPRALQKQLNAMRVGEFSRVIKTPRAAHLYYLLEMRNAAADEAEATEQKKLYKARHILIRTNPIDDSERVKRRMQRMRRDLESGKRTFGELARRYSADPISSFKGGMLGWVSPDTMVPEFAEQLVDAPLNEIVGPFSSSYGEHLLEVLATRIQSDDMSALRQRVEAEIRKRKLPGEIRQWRIDLRNRYYVDVRLRKPRARDRAS